MATLPPLKRLTEEEIAMDGSMDGKAVNKEKSCMSTPSTTATRSQRCDSLDSMSTLDMTSNFSYQSCVDREESEKKKKLTFAPDPRKSKDDGLGDAFQRWGFGSQAIKFFGTHDLDRPSKMHACVFEPMAAGKSVIAAVAGGHPDPVFKLRTLALGTLISVRPDRDACQLIVCAHDDDTCENLCSTLRQLFAGSGLVILDISGNSGTVDIAVLRYRQPHVVVGDPKCILACHKDGSLNLNSVGHVLHLHDPNPARLEQARQLMVVTKAPQVHILYNHLISPVLPQPWTRNAEFIEWPKA